MYIPSNKKIQKEIDKFDESIDIAIENKRKYLDLRAAQFLRNNENKIKEHLKKEFGFVCACIEYVVSTYIEQYHSVWFFICIHDFDAACPEKVKKMTNVLKTFFPKWIKFFLEHQE